MKEMPRTLTTIPEAAKNLNVCEAFLYKRVRDGSLPHFRLGADYRIDLTEVREHFRAKPSTSEGSR